MSTFVRQAAGEPFPHRAFVADLVALEWAIVEVIHAAGEPPLTLEALGDVSPAGWADLRLVPTPAFRLLRFGHPVNGYFQAFRDGEAPAIPPAAPSATVVHRSGSTVWRMDLTDARAQVLSALAAGATLATALTSAAAGLADLPEGEVAAQVTTWFREWIGQGLFVRALWPPP
jgi:hypothetical protein